MTSKLLNKAGSASERHNPDPGTAATSLDWQGASWPASVSIGHAPSSRSSLLQGGIAGLLGSLVFLGVLALAAYQNGRSTWAGLNIVGAFWARWLQVSDRGALDLFYWDASLGGLLLTLLLGMLLGALLDSLLTRVPDDYPLAWGVIASLLLALLIRKVFAPALSPILVDFIESREFYAALGLAGAAAGLWLGRKPGRRHQILPLGTDRRA